MKKHMNRTITRIVALTLMLLPGLSQAQPNVEADLELLETALQEMINNTSTPRTPGEQMQAVFWGSVADVNSTYIEGFGVMFSVNQPSVSFSGRNSYRGFTPDKVPVFQDFLMDYADLIEGLKDNEQIAVVTRESGTIVSNTGDNYEVVYSTNGNPNNQVSLKVAVYKKDLQRLYSGIDREAFREEYIMVERSEANNPGNSQLAVFSKLLHKRFSVRSPETFVCIMQPRYEYISGLGALIHLNVSQLATGSAVVYAERFVRQVSPEAAEDVRIELEQSLNEADQELEKRYNTFENQMREFLVKYTRTLSFLGESEKVIIKVDLPDCYQCSLPGEVEFSVDKSIINKLATGKIDLNEAMDRVQVK